MRNFVKLVVSWMDLANRYFQFRLHAHSLRWSREPPLSTFHVLLIELNALPPSIKPLAYFAGDTTSGERIDHPIALIG